MSEVNKITVFIVFMNFYSRANEILLELNETLEYKISHMIA